MKELSMVALLALGITSEAMAEVTTQMGGQAVFYYQTNNGGDNNFFEQGTSSGNAGLQLDIKSDIGHDFGLGYQGTFLGTLDLDKNIILNERQYAQANKANGYATTKLYITKKVANSYMKFGRQSLPKSLSPLAFSEGWNVFKNTFDAAVLVNKDFQDTTIVGAYVGSSNKHDNLSGFDKLTSNSTALGNAKGTLNSGAYMLTVANESMKNVPITASYYALKDIAGADSGEALWLDVKSKKRLVNFAGQAGQIDPSNNLDKTVAFGAKMSGKVNQTALSLAYSNVNDGDVQLRNVGTAIKTPLYTQIIGNQNFISLDNDTVLVKAVTKLPVGKLSVAYDYTQDNSVAKNDYQELDVVYKFVL